MSQYIPTGGFKWFSEKAINKVNLAEYTEVGGKNDMIVIMTTNLPLKKYVFLKICFQIVVKR